MSFIVNTVYIQELMDKRGWTLGQLSIKSGVSKAQLCRIINEKRGAGAKSMAGIIKAFPDADVEKLFFETSVTKE